MSTIIETLIDGSVTWRMICLPHGGEAVEWQEKIHEDSEMPSEVLEWIHGLHQGMDVLEIGNAIARGPEVGVQLKRIKYRNRRLLNMVVVSSMWA
jgi:hypothetical protein